MGGMANTSSAGSSRGIRLVASTVTVGQAASSDASKLPTCGGNLFAVVQYEQRLPICQRLSRPEPVADHRADR